MVTARYLNINKTIANINQSIKVYPAEEVTIDNKGHVLAYGITKEIMPGLTLEETLDQIKKQNGLSCAAHPFAVSNGIREKSIMCDLIDRLTVTILIFSQISFHLTFQSKIR